MTVEGKALNYQKGDYIDHTPAAAVLGGMPTQIGGLVGIPKENVAASVQAGFQVLGTVRVQGTSDTGSIGDDVFWDANGSPVGGTASSGACTTVPEDGDFWMGTLALAKTATQTHSIIALNVKNPLMEVRHARVTLTSAQILLLATTQIELVPAPGADKFIEVLGITVTLDYGTNVFTEPSAPDDLEFVYDTAGGTSIADLIGDFVISAADTIAMPQIKALSAAASTYVNKAVVLDNNGGDYGGNAGDDSEITVEVTYRVVNAGLA